MDQLSAAEIAWIAEIGEARAMADMYRAIPPAMAASLGARLEQTGPAVAMILASVPYILFNRVLGLGVGEPASEAMLDALLAHYHVAGVPPAVQLSPGAQPAALPAWLEARGLHNDDAWAKLIRGVEPPPALTTDLRVEHIGPAQAQMFAVGFTEMYGAPEAVQPWLAAMVGRPGWHHYLAFDGDLPVATAALFVQDTLGWLGLAATRSSHRRRGAQSALIARRITDAATAGCRWLAVETAPDLPERPNPSTHNLRRAGFEQVYLRPNYVA
jgi:hypothetical protein